MMSMIVKCLIYVFSFLGILSIGLLPYRGGKLLKEIKAQEKVSLQLKLVIVVFLFGALVFEYYVVRFLYGCLTFNYCGPNSSSGLLNLSLLAVLYLVYELLAFFGTSARKL